MRKAATVKAALPEGSGLCFLAALLGPRRSKPGTASKVSQRFDRTLERSALTARPAWQGKALASRRYIQRRSLRTAFSLASCRERWTKRFNALGFTRGAIPHNRQPRLARAWLVGIIGTQGLVRSAGALSPRPERGTPRFLVVGNRALAAMARHPVVSVKPDRDPCRHGLARRVLSVGSLRPAFQCSFYPCSTRRAEVSQRLREVAAS
jgi:hypothetical protein